MKNYERKNFWSKRWIFFLGAVSLALKVMIAAIFLSGCSKDTIDKSGEYLTSGGVSEVLPANHAESVEVNPVIGVTFLPGTDQSHIASSKLILSDGSAEIQGDVAVSGRTALFAFHENLKPMTDYVATFKSSGSGSSDAFEYSWNFKTGSEHKDNSLTVVSVKPASQAKDVPVSTAISVTLNRQIKSWMEGIVSVTLESGTTPVTGALTFSDKTITFTPSASLTPGTVYTGRFSYGPNGWINRPDNNGGNDNDHNGNDDDEGDDDNEEHTGDNKTSSADFVWNFTTAGVGGGATTGNDVTPPSVSSVVPAANAVSVATNSTVTVTFSEPVNTSTLTSTSFTVKQGSTAVPGSVTSSGSTATFSPAAAFAAEAAYTATLTTDVKDLAGNALAASYSWSFTTAALADVTPPQVSSVTPADNSSSVEVNTKITVTFSEPVNSSTLTASTFSLKQGSTTVSGTISYSGNTATLTPSAALTEGTAYTATVTTGVKDAAGNPLASNYSWSFTTVAAATGLSFANDVIPVLTECNACHKHPWTTSNVASDYYNNLVNGGYINVTTPSSGKIYTMLNSGHATSVADRDKILQWISEGSKNN